MAYFSNFLEDKDRRFKTNFDPQPNSSSQPKARGLLHMKCEFNLTPYKRRLEDYSGYEHFKASMQQVKYSEDSFKMKFRRIRR
jgi:hypothetical protein